LKNRQAALQSQLLERVEMAMMSSARSIWLREQRSHRVRSLKERAERGQRKAPGCHHHQSKSHRLTPAIDAIWAEAWP
jgi:hypothetical protein